jgi:hypothetical protein
MVRPAGFEPTTTSLEGRCSIQLSYGRADADGANVASRSHRDKGKGRRARLTRPPLRATYAHATMSLASPVLPPCPHLPAPRPQMDWRVFTPHGEDRGAGFYHTALEYGHYLWQHGHAARAVLCLDRAMGAELRGDEPTLQAFPMPYAAMTWFLTHTPPTVFIGNPRVHFQHYADRMNHPRRDLRRARAWACWALTRRLRPSWPADLRHAVTEPTLDYIAAALDLHGLPGETALWQHVLAACAPIDTHKNPL